MNKILTIEIISALIFGKYLYHLYCNGYSGLSLSIIGFSLISALIILTKNDEKDCNNIYTHWVF